VYDRVITLLTPAPAGAIFLPLLKSAESVVSSSTTFFERLTSLFERIPFLPHFLELLDRFLIKQGLATFRFYRGNLADSYKIPNIAIRLSGFSNSLG
jgi:hypothetical protein